jgi:glyoxylase-like metal-dependent hydrolase (beta-lactamase superfamily II)
MPTCAVALPDSITVLERGWLSSNNIVIRGKTHCALIDSGYGLHAPQTLALVASSLRGRKLDLLLNTHLHSDHCGGNAALQQAYPGLRTLIPPGQAPLVQDWDPVALTYEPTGQVCPQFVFDDVLQAGTELQLGDSLWQVHAAPGHDTHSIILFEPVSRVLVSADALWERGFGVVFPVLDGDDAFSEVADTLDVIEALKPAIVIPGHGAPFVDVAKALGVARQRLDTFVASPDKHMQYAAKALFKFKLLEVQQMSLQGLLHWASSTHYFSTVFAQHFAPRTLAEGMDQVVRDLVRAGAATLRDDVVFNA